MIKPEVKDYSEANSYIIRQKAEQYLLDFVIYHFYQKSKVSSFKGIWGLNSQIKSEISLVADRTANEDPAWTQHFSDDQLSDENFNVALRDYAQKTLSSFLQMFLNSLKTNGVPREELFLPIYDNLVKIRMKSDFDLAKVTLQEFHTWTKESITDILTSPEKDQNLESDIVFTERVVDSNQNEIQSLEKLIQPFQACKEMLTLYASVTYSMVEVVNYRNANKDLFVTDEIATKKYILQRTSIDSKIQNLLKVLESELAIFTSQLNKEMKIEKLVESSSNVYRLAIVLTDLLNTTVQNSQQICDSLGVE